MMSVIKNILKVNKKNMNNLTKKTISKFLPLIILYIIFIATFLGNGNYESIITLTAAIPLIVYIFNKNPKIEKKLRYVLYLFSLGLLVYLITLLIGDYRWFSFCLRNYYNETPWNILKWNQFFIYDLKYLIYIGIIFLALKNKKYGK